MLLILFYFRNMESKILSSFKEREREHKETQFIVDNVKPH